ncbi:MAG: dynamin family protein [Planctomycetota bacterium]
MQTKLSQFRENFDSTVSPLLKPLAAAVEALTRREEDGASLAPRDELAELHGQFEALIAKVRAQEAYVLIFGPLKSGKSTLMNAVAGAYVSEVSSLPAYPCLVFVSHGEKRQFSTTTYEGKIETFAAPDDLRARIDTAHDELADRIRAVEAEGEVFSPEQHLPVALKRVDVRLPAEKLAPTGAVLVDTPGLYTRMRFGYDRMTRDFRHAAACAIFVVKTDNLFLEQVFAEFHQLLELFSRIFLVVNVDTTKRDVGPDGELVPSLEQRSPKAILDVFEKLAMTAPLRRAADEGRLRLYPVDLLHAASSALRPKGKPGDEPEGFARFRDDLHSYLHSTDYLFAFLRDSLHRAHRMLEETERLADGDDAALMRQAVEDVEKRRTAVQEELDGIAEFAERDWRPAFANINTELTEVVQRVARDSGTRVANAMGAALDHWFLSSHSLDALINNDWQPLVNDHARAVSDAARRWAEQTVTQSGGGLEVDAETQDFLHQLGIDVRQLRQQALQALDENDDPPPAVPIDPGDIPVRRGVVDLMAMRSEGAIRHRVFGPDDRPEHKIPARLKKARLGEPAKAYLRDRLLAFRKELLPGIGVDAVRRYRDKLARHTVKAIQRALRSREPALRDLLEDLATEAKRLASLLEPLDKLQKAAHDVRTKVHALAVQHANTDPESLIQEPPGPVLQPQAPPETRVETPRRRRHRAGRRAGQ